MNAKVILYIEDSDDDVLLMRRAFKEAAVSNPLITVADGQHALDYLSGRGDYADRAKFPAPSLVLLDLKLPIVSGLDVLKWMRAQPAYSALPVIVISSSNQDGDIHRAYVLTANGYLIKPTDPRKLAAMVSAIRDYWLFQNCMPSPYLNLTQFALEPIGRGDSLGQGSSGRDSSSELERPLITVPLKL